MVLLTASTKEQTPKPPAEVKAVTKVERLDLFEETKIEKEVVDRKYSCFKAYRSEGTSTLDKQHLEKLNLQPKDSSVPTEARVRRWTLVSIGCIKE
jgi:hypothetical protein